MDSSPDSDQTLKQSPWGGNAVQAQIQPQVPATTSHRNPGKNINLMSILEHGP